MAFNFGDVLGGFATSIIALSGIGMVAWSFSWYMAENPLNAIYWLILAAFVFRWAGDVRQNFEERARDADKAA